MARVVATPVEVGPFFVNDRLPNLFIDLSWDTGGSVDLGDWPAAAFTVYRLRGQATVMSGTKLAGNITYQVSSAGELVVIWPQAFTEPGWYKLRLTLTSAGGKDQSAQLLTFEIQDR